MREERLKHERLLREKELELQQERSLRIRMLSERLMEHERMDMQLQSYKDHIADITAYVVPEVRTLGQTSNTTHAHTRPPVHGCVCWFVYFVSLGGPALERGVSPPARPAARGFHCLPLVLTKRCPVLQLVGCPRWVADEVTLREIQWPRLIDNYFDICDDLEPIISVHEGLDTIETYSVQLLASPPVTMNTLPPLSQ